MTLHWQAKTIPEELRTMLKTLGESHPIREGKGLRLSFRKAEGPGLCEVKITGNAAVIGYSTPAQAGRALGALLAGLVTRQKPYRETTPFSMLGIMLDCSRNAVMTVEHLKAWMRKLALLGYNMVMLYTEDTYELPGEPYFGYQRGAYTKAELKAIDDYAAALNIEVIPCIQTLGHLENILRHPPYAVIKDTSTVMLVGEPKTYALIDKMIGHWKSVCRTNRIHIGMDETHDLGRGRYLDMHGFKRGFDLFNEHLAKVIGICGKHGLKPMIWSDMYFRLGSPSGQSYYDPATIIPKDVIRAMPKELELVYWDYYHEDKAFYLDWIQRHRKMGKEPLMGSGIWTWNKYWHDQRLTQSRAGPCIESCYEAKLKEIFFTQWGDDGAYCDHDSAFAGMTWCADKAYGIKQPSPSSLEKRFAAVCGGSYRAHMLAGDMHGGIGNFQPKMWDDPFFETHFRTFAKDSPRRMADLAKYFSGLAGKLKTHAGNHNTGDMAHAYATARAFAVRYSLAADLLAVYRKHDKKALKKIRARIPAAAAGIRAMEKSFRRMWLRHNKSQGLETIQEHFGMIEARYREMAARLAEYIEGRTENIAELDCRCPPG